MLEVTTATYTTEPQAWYEPLPGASGWQLLDPATGLALSRNEPHQWIQDDPVLQAGMLHLGRYGSNIKVEALMGRHTEAADLGCDFEDSVASSDAYCFELFAWDRVTHKERVRMAAVGEAPASLISPHYLRSLGAAAQLEPEKSFSDEPEVNRGSIDDFIISLRDWTPSRGAVLSEEIALKWLAMRTIRERYKVAKLGVECARLGLGVESPADVVMTVGSNHGGVLPRIGSLGLRMEVRYVDHYKAASAKGKILAGVASDGKIAKAEMAALIG